jgi:hypothetical protein
VTDAKSEQLGLLPRVVLVLVVLLLAAGVVIVVVAIWYGLVWEVIRRIWLSMGERWDGPLSFRFILQPLMAAVPAVRDGIKDARAGRSPFFWTVAGDRQKRVGRLREGLIATARIVLLGIVMDAIYRYLVFKRFYPGEALIVSLLLCFVPYMAIRGPVLRIARWWRGRAPGEIH